MSTADASLSVATLVLSLLGSWGIALQMGKRNRLSSVQSEAVVRLLPTLARIRGLLHASSFRVVQPTEVARAVIDFEEMWLQHGTVLPERVEHVRMEVRAAVGNYFGGSRRAALRCTATASSLALLGL